MQFKHVRRGLLAVSMESNSCGMTLRAYKSATSQKTLIAPLALVRLSNNSR